ncbi:sigma-70 family RNA polymerase sigma factor [Actinomadura sp. CNU-125]|uniref:sigma-70 family RNA polymerase sigma factor n=1 Tax=Actinomadura sp. CNU-125 TaxID=1904961 RepID=UPI0029163828|nr:sigma-70 family RNA polymerase sigma factor [Actinomadura sp. CNU-125]
MREPTTDAATEAFIAHRNLLFTVAYEMLGSAADAEDVLQETWLRWAGVDLATVREPRAYLVRTTTRQALMRLRTLRRRRESYVGPWLPEPLLTSPDVAEDVELADSVSMAMLLVLETLAPTERAVFVLREVFDLPHDEIAEAVGKSPAAVRQIAHRARTHVAARRPRGDVSAAESRAAVEAFRRALETGDLQSLVDVLAPDVVFLGDGGGVRQTVVRPIMGATGSAACWPSAFPGSTAPWRSSRCRSTAARRCSSGSTGRSTPSSRCASTTTGSPASTSCATRRNSPAWNKKPP